MPVVVRKKGDKWIIVNKDTGTIEGHSATKRKAIISAAIRNRARKNKS